MRTHRSPRPEKIDDVLSILANRHCRATLSHFQSADDVCPLEELADELTRHGSDDSVQLTQRLHHAVLPRLNETGALDYDERSRTIRYHGHDELETLLDAIATL